MGGGSANGARRLRLLLASSSFAALMVGGGAPVALAAGCAIAPTTNQSAVSNSGPINCIDIDGITVSGSVTNTSTGVITATGVAAPSKTGITVTNNASVGGGISNAGQIGAGASGIVVGNPNDSSNTIEVSNFSGGIANSGTISSGKYDVFVNGVSTFTGGINNSGTATSVNNRAAIEVADVLTFSGGIANSGKLTGASGVLVEYVSTFTGGIVNTGTLNGGDGGGIYLFNLSSFSGGIANGGAITGSETGIRVADVSTFSGGISNSGTISSPESGLFVYDVQTFGNGITNSGNISVGDYDGIAVWNVATFAGGISNSGTISVYHSGIDVYAVSAFSGGITNAGKITSTSYAGIALYTINTFTGNISNSGTIVAKTGMSVGYVGEPVSTFLGAIVNSGTIVGTGGTAIDLANGPAGMTIDILGGAISGNLTGAGTTSGDTVNFALGSGSFAYSDTIAGMQAVNVVSGTLFDGGAITAAGVTVNSGGTLAPGLPNTTGSLSIAGNLAFNGGDYEIQLTPGAHASATVSSNLTISNGTVALSPSGPYGTHYAATTFSILTYGTRAGAFNPNVTYTGAVQLSATPTISYIGNDVDLSYGNAIADLSTPAGASRNQQNVIGGVNTMILAGITPPANFQQLAGLSVPAYLNALTQLDGEDATGAQTGSFTLMNEFLTLMLGDNAGGGSSGSAGGLSFAPDAQSELPPDIAMAYNAILREPPKQSPEQRWSAWASGFGGGAFFQGNAGVGSANLTATTYGSAAGMEYRPDPNTRLGFALAGDGLNWGLVQGLGSGRADAFQAGVYGKSYLGAAYFSGALAFANNWFGTNRTAAFGDQLTATFTGQSYAARGETGYRYTVPMKGALIGVTPYGALQTQWFHTPAYSESDLSGGGFGLSYNANTANDTRGELGARFDDLTVWTEKPLMLRASLAWVHDWVSGSGLNAAFETLPGSNFTVNGAAVPRDSALAGVSAQYFFTANLSFTARFDGELASAAQTYAGTGTLRFVW